MKKIIVLAVSVTALVSSVFAGQSQILIAYTADADPTNEGFLPDAYLGNAAVSPLANDLGLPAWGITCPDNFDTQFSYVSGLSTNQQTEVGSQGFCLTLVARIFQNYATAFNADTPYLIGSATVSPTQTNRYDIDLAIDSSGNTLVVLPSIIVGGVGPDAGSCAAPSSNLTVTVPGSAYHTYQLVQSPATGLADLYVDGVDLIQGYGGTFAPGGGRGYGLDWGVCSGGGANFNLVQLSAGPDLSPVALITWTNPTPIVYGAALNSNQLNATANVPGGFAYNPTNGTVLTVGTNTLSVTFTPTETADRSVINSVSLLVLPASLTMTASNAARAYGQSNPPLTGAILGLTNSDAITVTYTCGATSSSPVAGYPIVPLLHDPSNRLPNYAVTTNNGTLTVTQAVPSITWSAPSPITYGTALGSSQLDATANVAGTHNYTPPAGTVLSAGTHTLTDVFSPTDALDYSIASTNVPLLVLPVTNNPTISLIILSSQSAYCPGGAITLEAIVSNAASLPTSVAFYSDTTTFLGSTNAAPYDLSWTPASPGSYSLTATATFADGSTLTSAPLGAVVSPACGQVALVANGPAPELTQLTNLLLARMGLTSTLFTQAGLSAGALAPFELVIWDNLGGQTNQITDNTVQVLGTVWSNGVPLYLMGDHLADTSLQSAGSTWVQLTGLLPASGTVGNGSITFSSSLVVDPIVKGPFGTVSHFAYSTPIDAASPVDTNADATLGQSGTEPVFLTSPPTDVAAPGPPPRLATQNFQTTGGTDPNALAQRQALFLNAVAWLLQYQPCPQFSADVAWSWTNTPIVGQPLTIQGVAGNNGECDAIGVIFTNWLPAGMQFVNAQSQTGHWFYDAAASAVIFDLGVLPHQQSLYTTLSFTVLPTLPGPFTILTDVNAYGRFIQQIPNPVTVAGLGLTPISGLSPGYLLQLSGAPGQTYQIQTSTNLLQWTNWTNVLGPTWSAPILLTNFPSRFFRKTN